METIRMMIDPIKGSKTLKKSIQIRWRICLVGKSYENRVERLNLILLWEKCSKHIEWIWMLM